MLRGVKNKVVAGGGKVVAGGSKVVAGGGKVVAGVRRKEKEKGERDTAKRKKSGFLLTGSLSTATDAPRKSGVLIKYTNPLRGWKPRLFTLEMGLLVYKSVPGSEEDPLKAEDSRDDALRKSHSVASQGGSHKMLSRVRRKLDSEKDKEKDVRGVIEVQHAVVTADESDLTRFAIDTGHDLFHVKAQSESDRDEWLQALLDSRQYFAAIVERAAHRSDRNLQTVVEEDVIDFNSPQSVAVVAVTGDATRASSDVPPASPRGGCGSKLAAERVQSADAMDRSAGGPEIGAPPLESLSVKESGLGSRSPSSYSATLNRSPSVSSTVCTQMEDDGLVEAEASRRTLIMELRRVCRTLVPNEDSSLHALFDDVDAASGVRDLATWALHVLQTDRAIIDRQIATGIKMAILKRDADVAYMLGATESDPGDDDDDEVDEAEFFDAKSRTTSLMLSHSDGAIGEAREGTPVGNDGDAKNLQLGKNDARDGTTELGLSRVPTVKLAATARHVARKKLPKLDALPPKLNVWGILKDAAGKDLSRISIPVGLNEPISFLQRLAEDIEYSELLDQAAAEPDQYRRMMLVASMIISHYSSTQDRTGKPFNPLLGETFSLVMPNKGNGVRFVAEQVSHHPPVSACYAEGSGASWKYYNAIEVKNKFWGKSLEVFPTGWNHVEIPGYGDHYEFEQVTACVHNIFLGTSKMWLDNYGDMEIVNRTTGDRCEIKFQKSGMFSDPNDLGYVVGTVFDAAGKVRHKLSGRWPEAVYEDLPKRQKKPLWRVQKRPPLSASNNYNMTAWAIALNPQVTEEEATKLAPTDSRRRPDQRALEYGQYDRAGTLKSALEDGQRARRAKLEATGKRWQPKWFTLTESTESGRSEFLFNGRYFSAEAVGQWSDCADLFSCASGT